MVQFQYTGDALWTRMEHAVDNVIEIGLIDGTWPQKFPELLGVRLQQLIDDPDPT